MTKYAIRNSLAASAAIVAIVAATPSQAQTKAFNVPSQDAITGITELARQADVQILASESAVRGKRTNAVRGVMTFRQALEILLSGTGLRVTASDGRTYTLTADQSAAGENAETSDTIIVTGSRIDRAGFDRPTPTTVIGQADLRQGQRPNLQEALNDSPQFRPTVTSQTAVGNTASGNAPVDLRGLGSSRTLTLLNGRRFVGSNNLNYIPMTLVDRVEVVTGGASAAYGSDAVAGVVNVILKEKFEGISVGAQTGISSRGDGFRYRGDITAGTSFDDGRGQIMVTGEYVKDKSIPDRNSRRNLGSAAIVRLNPTDPADLRQILRRDINFGNRTASGLIISGALAGQMFNEDGTLRPYRGGVSLANNPAATPFPGQVIGGADAVGTYDAVPVTTPVERISAFGRISYEFGPAKIWADAAYGLSRSKYPFLPNVGLPANYTIRADNPFLNETIRAQLAAAGETSFTLGKFQTGLLQSTYDGTRTQKEGAIGIDVDLGGSWKIGAHYSHGETLWKQRVPNSIIVSRFNNAINAVSSNGQIVCAINADAVTANDDPACRPYNLFGTYAASPEALAYVRGTQRNDTTYKLDAAAVELTGDLFPLWAEPIAIAAGAEARFEEQKSVSGEPDLAGVYGGLNFYGAPVSGGFNVKEAFGEIAVPVFDISDTAKLDLNGAARYSDYSQSGGIWSWKGGATLNLFNSLLLRGTRSRDIRAPTIGERFATRFINIGALVDQDQAGRAAANPAYNPTPQSVTTYSGGNPDLLPEIGHTTTVGVTFSPKFAPGLSLSVDYYNITIDGQITTLSGGTLTLACSRGNTAACDRITRDATGTVTEVRSNAQNIAKYKQKGVDFDAAYLIPMERISSSIPGSLRIRAIATYVDKAVTDTGASVSDAAGNAFSLPKWRGFASMSYQNDSFGLDLRLRYIGKGKVNTLLDQEFIEATETTAAARTGYLVNNDVPATYYLDLGMQYKLMNKLTLSFNVNNLFDRAPPISTAGPAFHDVVGTYFTFGANVNF